MRGEPVRLGVFGAGDEREGVDEAGLEDGVLVDGVRGVLRGPFGREEW